MKTLKLMVLLAFIVVGIASRRDAKPTVAKPEKPPATSAAINQEIVRNAERLAETLRKCKQSAHKTKELK